MIIGIGVASIANMFMPALEDEFAKDKIQIEELYKVILLKKVIFDKNKKITSILI